MPECRRQQGTGRGAGRLEGLLALPRPRGQVPGLIAHMPWPVSLVRRGRAQRTYLRGCFKVFSHMTLFIVKVTHQERAWDSIYCPSGETDN